MSEWNHDIASAPRGQYVLRASANGKGHIKTYERVEIIAASACGVVNVTHYIPDERRWSMYTADHPPIAWMPYAYAETVVGEDGKARKVLPAHPTKATSWFQDLLRRAA